MKCSYNKKETHFEIKYFILEKFNFLIFKM